MIAVKMPDGQIRTVYNGVQWINFHGQLLEVIRDPNLGLIAKRTAAARKRERDGGPI